MQRLDRAPALAWAAPILTIAIRAAWRVVAQAAVTHACTRLEMGVLRFASGAILVLPLVIRRGFWPRSPGLRRAALALVGFGGVLFVLFLTAGLRLAPVADSGGFTPAMLPVFVALFGWIGVGARPGGSRASGLLLIVLGALGGWAFRAEALAPVEIAGLFAVTAGVALAAGALAREAPR